MKNNISMTSHRLSRMSYQMGNSNGKSGANRYRTVGSTYSYLKDPHLFYHLESPYKIKVLLDSGLF